VTDKPKPEVATLIAHPRAIRERLAHSLREADVLKRLLKAAEYAAERLNDQKERSEVREWAASKERNNSADTDTAMESQP
jgi:hypothetical protein